MGHEFRFLCQSETRRLLYLIGVMFVVVLAFQFFELPNGNFLSSIFPSSKVPRAEKVPGVPSALSGNTGNATRSSSANSTDVSSVDKRVNMTGSFYIVEEDKGQEFHKALKNKRKSDNVSGLGKDGSHDSSSLENKLEVPDQNSTLKNVTKPNDEHSLQRQPQDHVPINNVGIDNTSSPGYLQEETDTTTSRKGVLLIDSPAAHSPALPPIVLSTSIISAMVDGLRNHSPALPPVKSSTHRTSSITNGFKALSPALPPIISSTNTTSPMTQDVHLIAPMNSGTLTASHGEKDATDTRGKKDKCDFNEFTKLNSESSLKTAKVVSILEMNNMLTQNQASSCTVGPRWSSNVDQELLNAKSLIENAPIMKNDIELYAPLYRNVSMFKRSYELMEQTLKVYVYREGKNPIFHRPVLKGIYASEGWFMKLMEASKQFVTKNPREAHLFYLPFSSRMLEETLYVHDSHSFTNLIQYLKNYLDIIESKYPHWNRTDGADHFLVACHDWAPAVTKAHMANCIKALCNADIKEGFKFGKDVSLPETIVHDPRKPIRDLGGKPASERKTLAFFAGKMHGSVRPILLQYWQDKDPDMKILGRMPRVKGNKNYIENMRSSKYCICAKGYEVNSPRVVESIFYECVPVIISDNFVPPLFEVLDWESFTVFVAEKDIPNLKKILLSIPEKRYRQMLLRVKKVQQHFLWHARPVKYDLFHMILHSIWQKRVFQSRPT